MDLNLGYSFTLKAKDGLNTLKNIDYNNKSFKISGAYGCYAKDFHRYFSIIAKLEGDKFISKTISFDEFLNSTEK